MGCDFYISTYLKLYTSNGEFATYIDGSRGWFNSSNKKGQERQMASYCRVNTIYENGAYIDNYDEYNDKVIDFIKQLNDKIVDDDNEITDINLISFDDIIKITIFSRTFERT